MSVKSIKCHFSIAKFTNPKYRKAAKRSWEAALKVQPHLKAEPHDSNYLFTYFWVADQNRWRCDKDRLYPKTGYDFSQYIYDGEKYKFFDEYFDRAIITGEDQKLGFIKNIQSNKWLGFDIMKLITTADALGLGDLKKVGEENVAGRQCSIYYSFNKKENITFDLDNDNHLLAKFKDVTHVSPSYTSILNYEWSSVKTTDGVLIPYKCKLENYDVNDQVVSWVQTVIFQLKDCEINHPIGQGYFDHVLRVGTDLEDDIENPGIITTVGGDYSQEAEKVKDGIPPNPPVLDKDYKKSNAK